MDFLHHQALVAHKRLCPLPQDIEKEVESELVRDISQEDRDFDRDAQHISLSLTGLLRIVTEADDDIYERDSPICN